MAKIISAKEAVSMVKSGSRVMFSGFLAVGCPEQLIDALVEQNTKDIHMIVIAADYEDRGVGKLVVNKQIKSVQISHIGTNREMQKQYNEGELTIEFVPQGTLMERIRAAGAGIGGFFTPTGVGTVVEEGKEIREIDGKKYILEMPIHADISLIKARKADKHGNLVFSKTARNSNPIMATAGKIVIAEVDEIVENGEISAEDVVTPGIFVDYLVKREG
ncbi:MAG: branched-chain amino acid dehydrogenase [Candidatus Cloacimonadota bacterium]|nr:MAG: branched-chain amino acid dehydrogenase [Candidatus Cloacimonadota bacterium]